MRRLALAAVIASTAVAAACSSGRTTVVHGSPPPPFYDPEVALRNVRVARMGITGGTMDMTLTVYNPNDYALRAQSVAYQVLVDRQQLSEGVYDTTVVLPPGDSVVLKVPVRVAYTSAARGARGLLGDGMVNYRMVGRIHVGTPHGSRSAPYDRNGRFEPLTAPIGRASR